MQCVKRYTGELFNAVKKHKTVMNFDGFLYMIGTTPMLILTMALMIINFVLYSAQEMTNFELIINVLNYLVPTLFLPIVTAILAMILDKKPIKPMIKGLICYPIFMGSWVVINIKCLFKRETKWEKINHVRDIKIAEVKEEVVEKI